MLLLPCPSSPSRRARQVGWSVAAALCLLIPTAARADAARVVESSTYFGQLPEQSGTDWIRVGTAPALVIEGDRLLLNDNTSSGRIAYEGLLGLIESTDRVTLSTRVEVISNHDGDGALLEISRPGLEIVLRLRRNRIDLMERVGSKEMRWLASHEVDLGIAHDLRFTKTSVDPAHASESAVVEVDGTEVLRATPRGGGTLGVGRVLMGSLSYSSFGASIWSYMDVRLERPGTDTRVRTESPSMGDLKARWAAPR